MKTKTTKPEFKTERAKDFLFAPQARILKVLAGTAKKPKPAYCRVKLNELAGFTALSGTFSRAVNGSKHTDAGLLARGLVTRTEVPRDGRADETVYEITPAGRRALAKYLDGKKLGKVKDATGATNKRYSPTESAE